MPETLTPSASSAEAAGADTSTKDANSTAGSSDAGQGAKEPVVNLKDHLFPKDPSNAETAGAEDSPSSKSQETDPNKQDSTKKAAEPATDPANADAEKAAQEEADKKLPFHTHPRWRQMKNENAELRTKFSEVEGKVKELEPQAQAFTDFVGKVTEGGLEGKDVDELLNVGVTLKKDPQKAYEYLVDYVQKLGTQLGIILPPDLKKRVEDGYLSEEDAKALAKANSTATLSAAQLKAKEDKEKTESAKTLKTQMDDALTKFEFDWKSKDPDYEKLQPDVEDRFIRLCRETPPKNPAELVKLAEKALEEIRKRRTSGLPPKQQIKTPEPSGASVETASEPKNIRDVVRMHAKR